MKLSLVIPCFNEAGNLPALVARCQQAIAAAGGPSVMEILLVDNGSGDNTATILPALVQQQPGLKMVTVERNLGYGFGIWSGLQAADGEIVGWTHADMQTDPMDAVTALALFGNTDRPATVFVKGTRRHRALGDSIFTWGMAVFETCLLRVPLWDINAQPTLMPRRFMESWGTPPFDFSFDLFAYYAARRDHLSVIRIPVDFRQRLAGMSSWNVDWRSKMRLTRRIVAYSWRLFRSER
ncbi:glycosyltransferase family 2 protein [Ferrovibrio terrae]|uniref:glycosyltransferase family 2 protein n=1 Tax=Ferrovibrio terrae TaxID=2594003 RepID=UPI003138366C